MKKMLTMIIMGIVITIVSLSILIIISRVSTGFQETITTITQDIIKDEREVLSSGNLTFSEFRSMQDTLRSLNERISNIFK